MAWRTRSPAVWCWSSWRLLGRYADRNPRRRLSRRVRSADLAWTHHALHQRHSVIGAVDRDWPLCLCVLCRRTGHFSGFSGVIALALMVIPVVLSTTENMLRLVPDSLREAAFAARSAEARGHHASRAQVIDGRCDYRHPARRGPDFEIAPLLFTTLSNQFWSLDLDKPMADPSPFRSVSYY